MCLCGDCSLAEDFTSDLCYVFESAKLWFFVLNWEAFWAHAVEQQCGLALRPTMMHCPLVTLYTKSIHDHLVT